MLALLDAAESASVAKSVMDFRNLPRRLCPPPDELAATPAANGYASPPCYAGELGQG
jgi:hypothetical protein